MIDREKTAAEWADSDDVLPYGLSGTESDTGRHKYGDGESVWSDLPYPSTNNEEERELVFVNGDDELTKADGTVLSVGSGGSGGGGLRLGADIDIFDKALYIAKTINHEGATPYDVGIAGNYTNLPADQGLNGLNVTYTGPATIRGELSVAIGFTAGTPGDTVVTGRAFVDGVVTYNAFAQSSGTDARSATVTLVPGQQIEVQVAIKDSDEPLADYLDAHPDQVIDITIACFPSFIQE